MTKENIEIIEKKILNFKDPSKLMVFYKGKDVYDYEHPYLKMNIKDRCIHDIRFVYGFMTLKEQYETIQLFHHLIIKGKIKKRIFMNPVHENFKNTFSPRFAKLFVKMLYNIADYAKTREKFNRLQFYLIGKTSSYNLCLIFKDIDGLYFPESKSAWLKYSKIKTFEYIFFRPHENLEYNGVV